MNTITFHKENGYYAFLPIMLGDAVQFFPAYYDTVQPLNNHLYLSLIGNIFEDNVNTGEFNYLYYRSYCFPFPKIDRLNLIYKQGIYFS